MRLLVRETNKYIIRNKNSPAKSPAIYYSAVIISFFSCYDALASTMDCQPTSAHNPKSTDLALCCPTLFTDRLLPFCLSLSLLNVLKQTSYTTSHTAMVAPTALLSLWLARPSWYVALHPALDLLTSLYHLCTLSYTNVLQVLTDYNIPSPPSRTTPGVGLREPTKQQGLLQPVVRHS